MVENQSTLLENLEKEDPGILILHNFFEFKVLNSYDVLILHDLPQLFKKFKAFHIEGCLLRLKDCF